MRRAGGPGHVAEAYRRNARSPRRVGVSTRERREKLRSPSAPRDSLAMEYARLKAFYFDGVQDSVREARFR